MCDIGLCNGKGLLGQIINKIHENEIINKPIEIETYLINRENDIPKIINTNINNEITKDNIPNIRPLTDLQRWLYIYYNLELQSNENSEEINILNKRANIIEDAIKILINDSQKLNNEFNEYIHLTDSEKINDLSNNKIYDISNETLSIKWNTIVKYRNIFKNLFNILDEYMKKTVELNE
jgi:hypothetical protein